MSRRSIGAAASIPPNGASQSFSIGCVTTLKSAHASSPPSNIATWSRPCCVASPIRLVRRAAFAPQATNGSGIAALGGFPSDDFFRAVDPLLSGIAEKLAGRFATSNQLAGELCPHWAEKLGLRPGIPIPVGAFDAHWDAIGAGAHLHDLVNVIGTSTCIIGISESAGLVPGVCGVVPGSVDPRYTGIEAGLSATGDIFHAIARRAGVELAVLSRDLDVYRAGETGLLRLTWDNGDRTVLVNPDLGGVTLGWNLAHTAQDELFAAIEGTAFHTRVILERMQQHGVRIDRVINGGGIPHKNPKLNQVYADVLNKPVLVPQGDVTSLGSAIFAFLAAGAFDSIDAGTASALPAAQSI